MSITQFITPPEGKYDKVEAAYDGLSASDKLVLKGILLNEDYPHAQVARILQDAGYAVDRKQVFDFRQKIKLGRVTL
jgi:hypothetical protein